MFILKRKFPPTTKPKRYDMPRYRIISVSNPQDKNRFTETWLQTWLEEGYALINDNIVAKYAKYDSYSDDFLLIKQEQPIGTLRIVNQNCEIGLPMINDF